jgi:hypothetical protein
MIGPEHVRIGFDAHPHPNVVRPREVRRDLCKTFRALRQDLVCVLRRDGHDLEDPMDELVWNIDVEQIAHARR